MQIHVRLKNLASLTLKDGALLSAQHDVQLEEQLGNALQESLQQSEHAQISSQAKQDVVLMFNLLPWVFCSSPEQPEPLPQQLIIPVQQNQIHPFLLSIPAVKRRECALARCQGRSIRSHILTWGQFRVPRQPGKPMQDTGESSVHNFERTRCCDVSQS